MGINIINMLTANIINFGMFAVITTLIFIFANMAKPPVNYVIIFLVFIGSYVFLAWYTDFIKKNFSKETTSSMYSTMPQNDEETCSLCSAGKDSHSGSTLLPIMNPQFNLREVAKNLILLEDHLFHKGKRCPDCCVKHGLMIDGLLDEAKTLDKDGKYTEIIEDVSSKFKQRLEDLENCIKKGGLSDSNMCVDIAQQLRKIRKIITTAMIKNMI